MMTLPAHTSRHELKLSRYLNVNVFFIFSLKHSFLFSPTKVYFSSFAFENLNTTAIFKNKRLQYIKIASAIRISSMVFGKCHEINHGSVVHVKRYCVIGNTPV